MGFENGNRESNTKSSTLGTVGKSQLEGLCKSLKLSTEKICKALNLFDVTCGSWGDWDSSQKWNCFLSDHLDPFEFSIQFNKKYSPILRILIEPNQGACNNQSNWESGVQVLKNLEKNYDVNLSHFWSVANLFVPDKDAMSTFSLWVSVVLVESFEYKIYLNPNINGSKQALSIVEEAFGRLGLQESWKFMKEIFNKLDDVPNICYFSLDLSDPKSARAKIYVAATSTKSLYQHYGSKNLLLNKKMIAFLGKTALFNRKPLLICYAFDSAKRLTNPDMKLHLPVGSYCEANNKILLELERYLDKSSSVLLLNLLSKHGKLARISYVSFGNGLNLNDTITCYFSAYEMNAIPKKEITYMQVIKPFKTKVTEEIYVSSQTERENWMRQAKYNLVNLESDQICLDFLTDSGTGAMSSKQTACLITGDETYAGSVSFRRFKNAVTTFSGFEHILPVHQGRAAERILFSHLVKPGNVIPSNGHFDTTRANIMLCGGEALDIPCIAAKESTYGSQPSALFLGNADLVRLENLLQTIGGKIPFVIISVTNNAGGGQPVSIENIIGVSKLCKQYGKRFFIDSCRIAENAIFIKEREAGYYSQSVRSIICKILSYADGMTMSAKKDGLTHNGGWIGLNDPELAEQLVVNLTVTEGFRTYGGLAGRDLEAIAQGLEEVVDENYLRHRIYSVEMLGSMLEEVGICTMKPYGGHAVYIDAQNLLPQSFPINQFPAHSAAVALYIKSGIRTGGLGRFFHGNEYNGLELIRIALPRRAYDFEHFQYVQNAFKTLLKESNEILGLKIVKEVKVMRHFNAELEYVTA